MVTLAQAIALQDIKGAQNVDDSRLNSGEEIMHPFDVVDEFEKVVAEYAGAPYGVAVDSCTNALFLSLVLHRLRYGVWDVRLPAETYVGVAHAVVNAGHRCYFRQYAWKGAYYLNPSSVVDSARRFTKGMYEAGSHYCLSFHWYKHLPIGRAGMILLDNEEDYKLLRRMRYDGRTERVAPADDTFDVPGYHMMTSPENAAHGLLLMANMPDYNEDIPWDNYPDLSKHKYFTEANR
jgi:dTDP-4-amino-4,6-dideoxygalactose transaminase